MSCDRITVCLLYLSFDLFKWKQQANYTIKTVFIKHTAYWARVIIGISNTNSNKTGNNPGFYKFRLVELLDWLFHNTLLVIPLHIVIRPY